MRKSTLIAAVLFIGLLVGAIVTLGQRPERGMSRISLASINPNAVDRIDMQGPHAVALRRTADGWHLDSGRAGDATAITSLLGSVQRIVSSDLQTRDASRFAEFEVDDAKGTTVRLYSGTQLLTQFVVGKSAARGMAVRVDDAVYRVAGVMPAMFARSPMEWTERRLFPQDTMERISRLNLQLQDQSGYTLVRKGDASWEIAGDDTAPKDFRFDSNLAQSIMNNVLNMRLAEFVETDPGPALTGLDEHADKLTWYFIDDANGMAPPSHVLLLGKAVADANAKVVYAQVVGQPQIYTVPDYAAAGVRKPLLYLRNLSVMAFDPKQVVSLSLTDGKSRSRFDLKQEGWEVTTTTDKTPAQFALDSTKVSQRVMMASNMRALTLAKTADLKAAGLSVPKEILTVTLQDGKTASLRFGAAVDDPAYPNSFYALGNADGHVYVVSKGLHDNLFRGLESFGKAQGGGAGAPPQFDAKALQNLPPEVRASIQQQLAQRQQQ